MNPNTQTLHTLGQSLWIDNITREMLSDGTLDRYIADLSVTGLTSNPTIFEHAIGAGASYDKQIAELSRQKKSGEDLLFALALQDLTQAADLFRPIHDATQGIDGWVSLEVSPAIVNDTARTIEAAACPACIRRAAEPLHQDPRHARGRRGDRGIDLRRRAD